VIAGVTCNEGLIKKREVQEGVYMAGTLTKVINRHVLTSMLNTRDEEVKIVEPMCN
jgi:hypothetical protein